MLRNCKLSLPLGKGREEGLDAKDTQKNFVSPCPVFWCMVFWLPILINIFVYIGSTLPLSFAAERSVCVGLHVEGGEREGGGT